MSDDYTFDPVTIDPGDTFKVALDLFDICANFWTPNEQYALGEFVRPRLSTGFAYECTSAGTSGRREPIWNRTIGAVLSSNDGSVQWTCRTAGTNGLMAISSPSAVSDPLGLTISGVAVSESTKILATYAGSSLGQDFDAVYTFTLNDVTRIARQRIEIRKR